MSDDSSRQGQGVPSRLPRRSRGRPVAVVSRRAGRARRHGRGTSQLLRGHHSRSVQPDPDPCRFVLRLGQTAVTVSAGNGPELWRRHVLKRVHIKGLPVLGRRRDGTRAADRAVRADRLAQEPRHHARFLPRWGRPPSRVALPDPMCVGTRRAPDNGAAAVFNLRACCDEAP